MHSRLSESLYAEICLVCFLNKFSIVKRKIARKSWKSVILLCFSRPARFLHAVNTTPRCNVEIIRKLNLFKFFNFFFTCFAQLKNLIHFMKFSPNHTKKSLLLFLYHSFSLCARQTAILRDEVWARRKISSVGKWENVNLTLIAEHTKTRINF
jgi:hypothetical protein